MAHMKGIVRTMEKWGAAGKKQNLGILDIGSGIRMEASRRWGLWGLFNLSVEPAAGEGCYGKLLFHLACNTSRVKLDKKGCKVKMKPMSQALGMLCAFTSAGCSVPPQFLSLRQVQMCKVEAVEVF